MQELTIFLELIVKYGVPLILSGLFIWGAVDLYQTLKKNWVPQFLKSFDDISVNVKGLNDSLHALAKEISEQASNIEKIDKIDEKVDLVISLLKTA